MGYVKDSAEDLLDVPGLSDEDREKLRVRYERWDKLLDRGCIIKLHITAWRGACTIDEQALEMMGIPFREEEERKSYKAVVRMGQLALIPSDLRNQQNRIEQQARTLLDDASRGLIVGHFVPEMQVGDLLDRLKEKREQFMEFAREEIVAKLPDHKRAMRREYEIIFGAAYDRLLMQGLSMEATREEFIEKAIAYVYRNFPTDAAIEEKFSFVYEIDVVPFRDQLAEQEAKRAKLLEEAAESEEAAQAITLETQERLEAELRDKARPRAQAILESLDEAEEAMLSTIAAAAREVSDALAKNGKLPGKSSMQLNNMVDQLRMFREAGMLSNPDLDQSIDNISRITSMYAELTTKQRKEQVPELEASLRAIRKTAETLKDEMPSIRRVRSAVVEEEDEPAAPMERQVRTEAAAEVAEEEAPAARAVRTIPSLDSVLNNALGRGGPS